MKKIKSSIALKSISFVILMLIAFAGIVSITGYQVFSEEMYEEFATDAFKVARAAAHCVDADRMEAYKESGGNSEEYHQAWVRLDQLCNATESTFIYVIQPDLTDYGKIHFVFSTVKRNTEYSPYEVGYTRETTNDEYKKKYKALYTGEKEEELLLLNSRAYAQGLHHITAMVALKGAEQRTEAILCVQQQMDLLEPVRREYIKNIVAALLLVTLVAIVAEGLYLNRKLLLPVKQITGEASRFAQENVTAKEKLTSKIRTTDEIGQLAASIDQMEEQIVKYVDHLQKVTAERERIGAELHIASEIQENMLPRTFPPFPDRKEFSIYASMVPAKEVGGDFYDFFLIDEDHLALVIADVSGKGVPAALFMAKVKSLIDERCMMGDSPAAVMYHVNNQLCDGNKAEMFVTVWLAVLELSTGKGIAANAGHEHPVIHRAGGGFELAVYRHSLPLAAMEDVPYREHSFELGHGDSLFVYTDGVTEAMNSRDELFGTERMLEALNRNPSADPEALLQEVSAEIDKFVGNAPQFDDMTMLGLQYLGLGEKVQER